MKRLLCCLVLAACGDGDDSPDPGNLPATLEVFENPLRVGELAPVGLSWQFVDHAHAGPCDWPLEDLTCEPVTEFTFQIESVECDGCTAAVVQPLPEYVGFVNLTITATREGSTTLRVEIVDPDHDQRRSLAVTTPAIAPAP